MAVQHLTAECISQMSDVVNVVKSITTPHDQEEDGWLVFFGLALLTNCGLWVLLLLRYNRAKVVLRRHGIDLEREAL
jgi:hypothetical protein